MLLCFTLPLPHVWFMGGDTMLDAWVADLVVLQLGGAGGYGRCWLGGGKGRTYLSINVFYGGAGRKKGSAGSNCLPIILDSSSRSLSTNWACKLFFWGW